MIIQRIIQHGLLPCLLLLMSACSPAVDSLVCNRYTVVSGDEYRLEQGILSRTGFTPTVSVQLAYHPQVGSREEIEKLSGKLVLTKGLWESLPKPDFCERSKETYRIGGVEVILINKH